MFGGFRGFDDDRGSYVVAQLGLCATQPKIQNLYDFFFTLGVPEDTTADILRRSGFVDLNGRALRPQ